MTLIHLILAIISHHQWIFIAFRWIFIGILVWFWPNLIKIVSKKQRWNKEKEFFWIKKRWRLLGWFTLFELLIWL